MKQKLPILMVLALAASASAPPPQNVAPSNANAAEDRNAYSTGYTLAYHIGRRTGQSHVLVCKVLSKGLNKEKRQEVELQVSQTLGTMATDKAFKVKVGTYSKSKDFFPDPSDKTYLLVVRPTSANFTTETSPADIRWSTALSRDAFWEYGPQLDLEFQLLKFMTAPKDNRTDHRKAQDILFEFLGSEDSRRRGLAAGLAVSNHIFGLIDASKDDSADRFAKTLLANKLSFRTNTYLSRVFSANAQHDPYPNDPDLLAKLFQIEDLQVRRYVLGGIHTREEQSEKFLPAIRKYLLSDELDAHGLSIAFRQVQNWKKGSEMLISIAKDFALGKGKKDSNTIRTFALDYLLVKLQPEELNKVILQMIGTTDVAAARYSAATLGVKQAVQVAIQAVRDEKIQWSDDLAYLCQALTGRYDLKSWEQWNQWWTQAEKSVGAEKFIANGFAQGEMNQKIAAAIDELESRKFAQRQQARQELGKYPLHPDMPAVKKALAHGTAETRNSINGLLIRQQTQRTAILGKLRAARSAELKSAYQARSSRSR